MTYNSGLTYSGCKDITPADDTDIAFDNLAISVEVAGDITFSFTGAPTVKYTHPFGVGCYHPIGKLFSIDSTDTTATGIKVWH